MSFFDAYNFLARGGWLMIPIAICSVAGLAFFLERIWRLRRSQVLPEAFIARLFELIEAGEFEKAEELCRQSSSPLGAMVAAAVDKRDRPRAMLKEIVEEEGQREVFYLERFVNALGAIATITPLLGLLGTVVGMIDVFQDVVTQSAANGQVQAAGLATGIWQALITTASGLTVAIPVYLGYRYILSRIDQYAVDLEELALRAIEHLASDETPTSRAGSEGIELETSGEERGDDLDDNETEVSKDTGVSKEGVA